MKKHLILNFVCCILLFNASQAQITFEKYYGGGGFEEGSDVKQTLDGGYIMVGMTQTFGVNTQDDVYLVKTDAGGDTLWTKTFGGTNYDKGYSVDQTSDSGYIVTGLTNSFVATGEGVYLIKTDMNGNHLWSKTYGGNLGGTGYSVKQTADGGYIIGGTKVDVNGIHNALLIKTDDAGDTLWTKTYGNTGDDYGSSVVETYDGGFVIAGSGSTTGVCLLKTNSDGDTLWTRTSYYGLPHLNYPYTIQETTDSGFILAGICYGASGIEMYVRKTDSIGYTQWTKTYAGINNDYTMGIEQTTDGGYIMGGWSQSFPANGNYHSTVLRLDAAGDTVWTKIFNGGGGASRGYLIHQTTDEGFIFISTASQDMYLVKMDANGNTGCNQGYAAAAVAPVTHVPTPFPLMFSGGTVIVPATIVKSGCTTTTLCFTCNLTVSFIGLPDTICINGASFNLIGTPSNGTFNGAGISGNTFIPSVAGAGSHQIIYTYTLSDSCSASDTSTVFVDGCGTFAKNLNDESSFMIYPNPADEFLFIKNSFPENENITATFFDLTGKEIFTLKISSSNNKIQTSDFSNGIYFCQIKSSDKILNQKFIVQH